MILVLFGTSPYSFDRLASAVQELAASSHEEIIAQIGHTKLESDKVECFKFIPRSELKAVIQKADIVVTQGGFGSIADCLECRKKVVAVPRKVEYGEMKDKEGLGQEELIRELEKQGKLVGAYDLKNLQQAINKAKELETASASASRIPEMVLNYVRRHLSE